MDAYREDPDFRKKCDQLHTVAMANGDSYYLDPQTGLRVATAASLLQRGYCCNYKCRHCPYRDPKALMRYIK
jgi:hypothetical protein